jgi:hypothetical protein
MIHAMIHANVHQGVGLLQPCALFASVRAFSTSLDPTRNDVY